MSKSVSAVALKEAALLDVTAVLIAESPSDMLFVTAAAAALKAAAESVSNSFWCHCVRLKTVIHFRLQMR